MEKNWNGIRIQLIYYICCSIGIISNYFFGALFTNMYHQIKGTPDYKHILSKAYFLLKSTKNFMFFFFNYIAFPSVYPIWESKGMSFPYYHIQMFLSGCADYIAGMCK